MLPFPTFRSLPIANAWTPFVLADRPLRAVFIDESTTYAREMRRKIIVWFWDAVSSKIRFETTFESKKIFCFGIKN